MVDSFRGTVEEWLDQQLVRIYGEKGVPTISNTYDDDVISSNHDVISSSKHHDNKQGL